MATGATGRAAKLRSLLPGIGGHLNSVVEDQGPARRSLDRPGHPKKSGSADYSFPPKERRSCTLVWTTKFEPIDCPHFNSSR